jgi:Golgi nucleoside diphosphatase
VEKYAVVVDAGSTGSRAFVFRVELYADGRKVLHSHSCGKVREGLSFFSENRSGAHLMLAPLLREAASIVPLHLHQQTALYVKGTAGMRMLEEEAQEAIWDVLVRDLHWRSGLKFRIDRRNFGTITGDLEAFYAVLASNYIVGSIDGNLK